MVFISLVYFFEWTSLPYLASLLGFKKRKRSPSEGSACVTLHTQSALN